MLQTCPYNRCADVWMRENPEVERSKVLQLCRNKIGLRRPDLSGRLYGRINNMVYVYLIKDETT